MLLGKRKNEMESATKRINLSKANPLWVNFQSGRFFFFWSKEVFSTSHVTSSTFCVYESQSWVSVVVNCQLNNRASYTRIRWECVLIIFSYTTTPFMCVSKLRWKNVRTSTPVIMAMFE